MSDSNKTKRLLVGKINGLFGIKGLVKVFSYTKPRENITTYKTWHLTRNGNDFLEVIVQTGRQQAKTIVAQLKQYDTPEKSETLLGYDIYINKSDLPKTNKDEYYWDDLINMTVINQHNQTIGKVTYLIETGSNDVLVIKHKDKEILIPFINPFVGKISLEEKIIWVDWT
ncbi:16S rRNA processing protein RimM [hydrothermal vent metagenome]|uniref:16S rRNA processing protein RimM n=1 Tax=hydrothermal vent metagenome TaxID=652676 RepID=A0A1W1BJ04_9ZZZZ